MRGSDRRFTSGFERQQESNDSCYNEERSRDINRYGSGQVCVKCDDGCLGVFVMRPSAVHPSQQKSRLTMMPNTRLAVDTMALPVPRSFVGNNSGDTAYRTPYITLLVKVYPQFHPRSEFDVRAVVPTKRKTPVRTSMAYKQRNTNRRTRTLLTRGNSKRTLAAQERQLNHISGKKSSRNSNNA